MTTPQKGGFRDGSGRKPLKDSEKKVRRTVFIHPDLDRKLSKVMDAHGIENRGEVMQLLDENGMIDQLIDGKNDTLQDSTGKPIPFAGN